MKKVKQDITETILFIFVLGLFALFGSGIMALADALGTSGLFGLS